MLISSIILGWIGVLIYLVIVFALQMIMKNNEFAFLHILMALMHAMWLPLPLALNEILDSGPLQTGTIFELLYLFILVITMTLQTGHITYIVKQNEDKSISNQQAEYMMTTLSSPAEAFAGIFKSLWALFLVIAFWNSGEFIMASLMTLFSLLLFYYLFLVLDRSLVKQIKLFLMVKPNPYFINLESLLFFIILISYLTFNS